VIYTLEFYWEDEDGRRAEIGRQWQQANSKKVIEARARATIKNVVLGGRRINLCIIKEAKGKTLSIVVGSRKMARLSPPDEHCASRAARPVQKRDALPWPSKKN
jgi:hypothetical protein